jgi:hypothetical protein
MKNNEISDNDDLHILELRRMYSQMRKDRTNIEKNVSLLSNRVNLLKVEEEKVIMYNKDVEENSSN